MMLNPTWLYTYQTLVETGHFTQTAEKLHMTQPGVSQHIKKLEQRCGYPLIKRENKGFELTEQGKMLYSYARQVRLEESKLLEKLGADEPYQGTCNVACSGALALMLYPELLKLQQQHQGLHMQLEAAPNHQILSDVQSGKLDIGIVTQLPSGNLFDSTVIGYETLCLVLPRSYEGQEITPQGLMACGLIDHPDALHYLSLYFEQCGHPELAKIRLDRLPKTGYINQIHQILLPVANGLGFTVIPESAFKQFANKQALTIAPTERKVKETLYLVHKRHRDLPKRYETITTLLRDTLAQPCL
ncbi:LysR family transcriptional regulator [Shewanella gelidii]|uniref:LysR family transcriptional regulator n=1 Tax=Shewanella gelidii TaxID=1642821 RepID=A0A917N921_9GAMM|nr:LysR family transcriptional regulator [Shewanella gelidii]GGI77933.1 LysR family transcriptional regulator [Shewanella gelidii]